MVDLLNYLLDDKYTRYAIKFVKINNHAICPPYKRLILDLYRNSKI